MKLFKCTIECDNTCYVETFLIIAIDKKRANLLLTKHEKREITYTQPLQEIEINLNKEKVIPMIGFGESNSDYGFED